MLIPTMVFFYPPMVFFYPFILYLRLLMWRLPVRAPLSPVPFQLILTLIGMPIFYIVRVLPVCYRSVSLRGTQLHCSAPSLLFRVVSLPSGGSIQGF
jgi:hypothetical protein